MPPLSDHCAPCRDHGLHRWLHALGTSGLLGLQCMLAFFSYFCVMLPTLSLGRLPAVLVLGCCRHANGTTTQTGYHFKLMY